MENTLKSLILSRRTSHYLSKKFVSFIFFFLLLVIFLFHTQSSPFYSPSSSSSWDFLQKWKKNNSLYTDDMAAKLRDSVTFLPLKDLRFADTAMTGHTWFMSSLNDTHETSEAEYLSFPSEESKGRLLCIKGRNKGDGTKNSYALAWKDTLPNSAVLLDGLTFVSNTYYNYQNLWHGLCATVPFVRWSMKNGCIKPTRWVLFHWGELRFKMGSWLENLVGTIFGDIKVEGFDRGDERPYCFEKAVVVRHDLGAMGQENKLKVFDLLRCKARVSCGLNPEGRVKEVNERGVPIIRLTLLMRRGARSFKNPTAVIDTFKNECMKFDGCVFNVAQSEDLGFCDQVKVMTSTDIVASPHGAQLTNMMFMDRGSSVMEFFPKGWLELAGPGQYAHHWMADQSGMRHQGAWWDPVGNECPSPNDALQCFLFHKDGQVGQNETFFADWTRKVLVRMRISKIDNGSSLKDSANNMQSGLNACVC